MRHGWTDKQESEKHQTQETNRQRSSIDGIPSPWSLIQFAISHSKLHFTLLLCSLIFFSSLNLLITIQG